MRIHEVRGCGKVLVPTLRNRDIVFMDEIAQPGGLQEACS
jgi:hypothetical protein